MDDNFIPKIESIGKRKHHAHPSAPPANPFSSMGTDGIKLSFSETDDDLQHHLSNIEQMRALRTGQLNRSITGEAA